MGEEMMTREQAIEQAMRLKKQGLTYPKMEEHFKKIGYKSSRTKKHLGALAIRHMIKEEEKKALKEDREDAQEEKKMLLVAPGFRANLRKLSEVTGIDDETFMLLVKTLIAQQEKKSAKA